MKNSNDHFEPPPEIVKFREKHQNRRENDGFGEKIAMRTAHFLFLQTCSWSRWSQTFLLGHSIHGFYFVNHLLGLYVWPVDFCRFQRNK